MTTEQALQLIAGERQRQREIGTDGALESRNHLIATAMAYQGRAVSCFRNQREGHDPTEMLVKAAAVLVDAIEREDS